MFSKQQFLFTLTLLLALCITTFAQNNGSEADEAIIKLNTQLVTFDVQVLNKKTSTPLAGLTKDDFEVYEDNVKQDITSFSQDRLPISVLLLLDVSGSVENIIPQIQQSAVKSLAHLKPEDEVGLMAFASGTGALESFTTNKQLIINNITRVMRQTQLLGGNTFLNDALYEAANHMKKFSHPNYRRVIIVITDDILNKPFHGHKISDTKDQLLEAGIMVCGLKIEDPSLQSNASSNHNSVYRSTAPLVAPDTTNRLQRPIDRLNTSTNNRYANDSPSPNIPPPSPSPIFINNTSQPSSQSVEHYAQDTGGEFLDARSQVLEDRFTTLIDHLRARYSLAYTPSNSNPEGKFHKLKIKLLPSAKKSTSIDPQNMAIKTKRGYFAPKE